MAQIYFYSGARDKLVTACRLCAKALQQNMRVLIYTPDIVLMEKMDELLWTFSATSFVPHCSAIIGKGNEQIYSVSPVIISNQIHSDQGYDVLLNLHDQCPPLFEQFDRLIEIADLSNQDSENARERYRNYKQMGLHIQHYDLNDSVLS